MQSFVQQTLRAYWVSDSILSTAKTAVYKADKFLFQIASILGEELGEERQTTTGYFCKYRNSVVKYRI